jgi:hypothetical protein
MPFFIMNYSYFGRMDYYVSKSYKSGSSYVDGTKLSIEPDLEYLGKSGVTGKILTGKDVVMNDTLFQQNPGEDSGWSYNHGKSGASCHIPRNGTFGASFWRIAGNVRHVTDPESNYNSKLNVDAIGTNQLYGDGSVAKKLIKNNTLLNYKKFAEYAEEETVNADTQIACITTPKGDKSFYFPKK